MTPHEPDGPPVVHSHIAYFFVPLPEPLGLPDGHGMRFTEPPPAKWWGDGHPPEAEHMAASLRFHRAQGPSRQAGLFAVLFDIATRALPDPARPPTPRSGADDLPPEEMTIVEMAVGVDLDVDVGADADDDAGDYEQDGPEHAAISDAFDKGLGYVRDVQRSYYTARRRPIRLVAREALPFGVPFGVRRLYNDEGEVLPFRAPVSIYLVNMNVTARDAELDDDDHQLLGNALQQQLGRGAFTSYLDFVREAAVALDSDGAYRAAVLFTATACEVLLDDLLAHMLWQEHVRPEQAADVFGAWLTTRVKTQYHSRLGGNWSTTADGPIGRWAIDVAALRNRVVHGGYEPTLDEARAAADAAEGLQLYLGDLIADRTATYPRTAVILPGRAGLDRRGKWTVRLEAVLNDPDEVPWTETFARWRRATQRARPDNPDAMAATSTNAHTYLVVRAAGQTHWVVHDRAAGMAAVVDDAAVAGISNEQQEQLAFFVQGLATEGLQEDISIHVATATTPEPSVDAWVPEYRLVPRAGVMVDRSDLDDA